jgi:translation initiation factor IF-1
MKTIAFFVLSLVGSAAFGQQPSVSGAWLPVHAKWQHAPPEVNRKLITASTSVLYFQPDGKMVVIGCIVNREPGRYTRISAGDGQTVASGDWHEDHGRIVVRYQVVFRTVPRSGEKLPGPWIEDVLVLKDGALLLKGVRYQRVPELDKSAAEMVPQPAPAQP